MALNLDAVLQVKIDNKLNPVFVKANLRLLEKYAIEFDTLTIGVEKLNLLKKLWLEEYGAEISEENGLIENVIFSDKSKLTLFLIRLT